MLTKSKLAVNCYLRLYKMKTADDRMKRLNEVFKKVVDTSVTNIGNSELKSCFLDMDLTFSNDIQSILVNTLGTLQLDLEVFLVKYSDDIFA